MNRSRSIALFALITVALMPIPANAAVPGPVPINTVQKNATGHTAIVVAFCNATVGAKDLEGWVGERKLSMIASVSGNGRETITIPVPSGWLYQIKVVVPQGGSCTATFWPIQ